MLSILAVAPALGAAAASCNPATLAPTRMEPSAVQPHDDGVPRPVLLTFSGGAWLQYPGAAEYQMTGGGTIDLFFRATWDPAGRDLDFGFPIDRCILACGDNAQTRRFAVYVNGDLSGFALYCGSEWRNLDFQLQPGRLYHLALIMDEGHTGFVVDGAPAGVANIGPDASKPESAYDLFVGSDLFGKNAFGGELGNLRFWRAKLSLDEITAAAEYAAPARPDLMASLAASSQWTAAGRQGAAMMLSPALSDAVLEQRNSEPWLTHSSRWLTDLEAAKVAAKAGRLMLAYTTKVDGYDAGAALVQGSSLASEWWERVTTEIPTLLLQGTRQNPSPMGVPVGRCALMTENGTVIRQFVPWTEEFTLAVIEATRETLVHRTGSTDEDRAIVLANRLAWLDSRPLVDQVAALAGSSALSAPLRERLSHLLQVDSIRRLTSDYRSRLPFKTDAGTSIPFSDAHAQYVTRAMQLFDKLPHPLEPDPALSEFAYLLWEGLQLDPSYAGASGIYNFVIPLAGTDPILAVYIAATPDSPNEP